MRPVLKQVVAIFSIGVLLAPVTATLFFDLNQKMAQNKIKIALNNEILDTYTTTPGDIKWVRAGKEILIDGHLFDIKNIIHNSDGTITISGLFDETETVLVKKINETQEKNSEQNRDEYAQYFFWDISSPEKEYCILPSSMVDAIENFTPSATLQPFPYIGIPVPPPLA